MKLSLSVLLGIYLTNAKEDNQKFDGTAVHTFNYKGPAGFEQCDRVCAVERFCGGFNYDKTTDTCTILSEVSSTEANTNYWGGYRDEALLELEVDIDYEGYDLKKISAGDLAECKLLCSLDRSCKYFSYTAESKFCRFKTDTLGRETQVGTISGMRPPERYVIPKIGYQGSNEWIYMKNRAFCPNFCQTNHPNLTLWVYRDGSTDARCFCLLSDVAPPSYTEKNYYTSGYSTGPLVYRKKGLALSGDVIRELVGELTSCEDACSLEPGCTWTSWDETTMKCTLLRYTTEITIDNSSFLGQKQLAGIIEPSTVFDGANLDGHQDISAADAAACSILCTNVPECKAWFFLSGKCSLKSKITGIKRGSGTSGTRVPPAPTTIEPTTQEPEDTTTETATDTTTEEPEDTTTETATMDTTTEEPEDTTTETATMDNTTEDPEDATTETATMDTTTEDPEDATTEIEAADTTTEDPEDATTEIEATDTTTEDPEDATTETATMDNTTEDPEDTTTETATMDTTTEDPDGNVGVIVGSAVGGLLVLGAAATAGCCLGRCCRKTPGSSESSD